jgi:hypothetical protein
MEGIVVNVRPKRRAAEAAIKAIHAVLEWEHCTPGSSLYKAIDKQINNEFDDINRRKIHKQNKCLVSNSDIVENSAVTLTNEPEVAVGNVENNESTTLIEPQTLLEPDTSIQLDAVEPDTSIQLDAVEPDTSIQLDAVDRVDTRSDAESDNASEVGSDNSSSGSEDDTSLNSFIVSDSESLEYTGTTNEDVVKDDDRLSDSEATTEEDSGDDDDDDSDDGEDSDDEAVMDGDDACSSNGM